MPDTDKCESQKKSFSGINYAPFIASAAGGVVETAFLHPFDTIAKRLQANKTKVVAWNPQANGTTNFFSNIHSINQVIFRDQANAPKLARWMSLYPGVGYSMLYKIVQRTYKIGAQSNLERYLLDHSSFLPHIEDKKKRKLYAAATSGSLVGGGEVVLLPLDVLKVKFQTNKSVYQEKSFWDIWKSENPYRGLSATLPRNIIGSGALFGTREYLKANGVNSDVANLAGITVSIVVTSPFDVIKTRMQAVQEAVSPLEVFKTTVAKEGVAALSKGVVTKVITQGPKWAVCFAVADRVEKKIEERLAVSPSLGFFTALAKKDDATAENDTLKFRNGLKR